MLLECLEGGLNEVTEVVALPLVVFDLVSQIDVPSLHQVQHWENLTVIRH